MLVLVKSCVSFAGNGGSRVWATLFTALLLPSCNSEGSAKSISDSGPPANPGPLFHFDAAVLICSESGAPDADTHSHDDASACTPSRQVSYVNDVVPVFAENCTGEVCHNGSWGGGAAHDLLVGIPASECCDGRRLVLPGDPDDSYVIQKLRGVSLCAGRSMPYGRTIDPRDVATIADWICEGAPGR